MDSRRACQKHIIPLAEAGTLPGLFLKRLERTPKAIAYCEHRNGQWNEHSWAMMAQRVFRLRSALNSHGLKPRDRVAVLLPNSTDWVSFDIAAMANGLILVPLFAHDSPENIAYVMSNAGARLCFIDTVDRWLALAPALSTCEELADVWVRDGLPATPLSTTDGQNMSALCDVLAKAEADNSEPRCNPRDIATIIYTSGTTGRPKGVMLTHAGILWNAEALTKFIPPLPSDVFLSILPLAHGFERTLGYYLPMMAGSRVAYARSAQKFREDLLTTRPTVLFAVPRLYERIYDAIRHSTKGHLIRRRLVELASCIGWQQHDSRRKQAQSIGFIVRGLLGSLLDWLVGRRIRSAFGGRLRVAVSGGGALPLEVSHFFVGLGLPLIEGYGLTEAGPAVTATTIEDSLPGSVGRPLPGLDLRLGERSELIVRSPSVMRGYWQDPDATAKALSADGWLKTGDIAEIREGRIYITGRLKDLAVLSTGENVVPTSVETAIGKDPLFKQVCVIGDARPCLVAIAVLNQEHWSALARQIAVDTADMNSPTATAVVLSRIETLTHHLPSPWRVRAIHITDRPWTVADGSLTPTYKIKRRVIQERFGKQIDALYSRIAEQR